MRPAKEAKLRIALRLSVCLVSACNSKTESFRKFKFGT